MLTNKFFYNLPEELIAKYPSKKRTASRLLYVNGTSGVINHSSFLDVCSYFSTGDLLVMNDSKVIPARLFGQKASGGKVEILLERVLSQCEALAHIRASKAPKNNTKILLASGIELEVIARRDDLFHVKFFEVQDIFTLLQQIGQVPLPHYIDREAQGFDVDRYQTVYAKYAGSVAAPTAGLHFDEELLHKINIMGVDFGYVTLHVGAGTFQPIRVDDINEHYMHQELVDVSPALCAKIQETKRKGGRVIAVGTTTVRALETAALNGKLQTFSGDTDIFIKPGFQFKVVDALITNFHLPMSTLLVLTCAFGGLELVLQGYQEAIKHRYRFYSYGDAMFITKNPTPDFAQGT